MFPEKWYAKQYWKLRHMNLRWAHSIAYDEATGCHYSDEEYEAMDVVDRNQKRLIKYAESKVSDPNLIAQMKPIGFDRVWWVGDLKFPELVD